MTAPWMVKIGGGLLSHLDAFDDTLSALTAVASDRHLIVVGGGGPFANAVRDIDRRMRLGDDDAHWMAVLAMDQYAHLITGRLAGGELVHTRAQTAACTSRRRIPVIAPYQWMRDADPLPHSWDVTSDSIAAWLAGELNVDRLLLVKPPDATEPLVDPYFARALPTRVAYSAIPAGPRLRTALAAR